MQSADWVGYTCGFLAYFLWGVFPGYFKLIDFADPVEILCHRILWSAAFLWVYLAIRGQIQETLEHFRNLRTCIGLFATSALICSNWLIYTYAVQNQQTINASLGYFINPTVIIILGITFLHERLNVWQGICMAFAATGILYLFFTTGELSWISISLPVTFGIYGLIRKHFPVKSIQGLCIETTFAFPLAIAYAGFLQFHGQLSFVHGTAMQKALLGTLGIVTSIPLILFAEGTRRIPYSHMGFLQYIAPTIQLFIGVLIFAEPFSFPLKLSFGLVWVGLIILMLGQLTPSRH